MVVGHRGVEGTDTLAARRLAPLPWTVYCRRVFLKRGFLFQLNVAFQQRRVESYLTQLVWWECRWEHYLVQLRRLLLRRGSPGWCQRYRRCCGVVKQCSFLDTDWVGANNRRDVTFSNHAGVVGRQTLQTEDVSARAQSVTLRALLRLEADSAFVRPLLKLLFLSDGVEFGDVRLQTCRQV